MKDSIEKLVKPSWFSEIKLLIIRPSSSVNDDNDRWREWSCGSVARRNDSDCRVVVVVIVCIVVIVVALLLLLLLIGGRHCSRWAGRVDNGDGCSGGDDEHQRNNEQENQRLEISGAVITRVVYDRLGVSGRCRIIRSAVTRVTTVTPVTSVRVSVIVILAFLAEFIIRMTSIDMSVSWRFCSVRC